MMIGSVVVALFLFILGWTKEIVGHFVEEGEFRRTCTIVVAVLSIYAVDFAINAGKTHLRGRGQCVLMMGQCKVHVELWLLICYPFPSNRQVLRGLHEWHRLGTWLDMPWAR